MKRKLLMLGMFAFSAVYFTSCIVVAGPSRGHYHHHHHHGGGYHGGGYRR